MSLGIDFVIYSSILLTSLIPIYIFREKIFKFLYKTEDFETFISELKKHLIINHPSIDFDYSIIEKTKNEENPKTRQTLVVEDILMQFAEYELNIETQHSVNKEFLWQTYEADSIPQKEKLPKDWLRRKDTIWKRDKSKCLRCGLKVEMNDAQVYIIRDIENGGTYHFENLLTLCHDCNRILKSEDLGKVIKSLNILDDLMHKVIA